MSDTESCTCASVYRIRAASATRDLRLQVQSTNGQPSTVFHAAVPRSFVLKLTPVLNSLCLSPAHWSAYFFSSICLSAFSALSNSVRSARTGSKKRCSYRSAIPAFAHSAAISGGHTLTCVSPMCALRRKYMHSRDCPIPPPTVYGSSRASSLV